MVSDEEVNSGEEDGDVVEDVEESEVSVPDHGLLVRRYFVRYSALKLIDSPGGHLQRVPCDDR